MSIDYGSSKSSGSVSESEAVQGCSGCNFTHATQITGLLLTLDWETSHPSRGTNYSDETYTQNGPSSFTGSCSFYVPVSVVRVLNYWGEETIESYNSFVTVSYSDAGWAVAHSNGLLSLTWYESQNPHTPFPKGCAGFIQREVDGSYYNNPWSESWHGRGEFTVS